MEHHNSDAENQKFDIDKLLDSALTDDTVRRQQQKQEELLENKQGKRNRIAALAVCGAVILSAIAGTGIYISKQHRGVPENSAESSSTALTAAVESDYVVYLKNNAIWYQNLSTKLPIQISEAYFTSSQHNVSEELSASDLHYLYSDKLMLQSDLQKWIAVMPDQSGIFYPQSFPSKTEMDEQPDSLTLMYRSLLDPSEPPVMIAEDVLWYTVLPDNSGICYLVRFARVEDSDSGYAYNYHVIFTWNAKTQTRTRIGSNASETIRISEDCKRIFWLNKTGETVAVLAELKEEPLYDMDDSQQMLCAPAGMAYLQDFDTLYWYDDLYNSTFLYYAVYDTDGKLHYVESFQQPTPVWLRQSLGDKYPTMLLPADVEMDDCDMLAVSKDASKMYFRRPNEIATVTTLESSVPDDWSSVCSSFSNFIEDDMLKTDAEMSRENETYFTERLLREKVRSSMADNAYQAALGDSIYYYDNELKQLLPFGLPIQLTSKAEDCDLLGLFFNYEGDVPKIKLSELTEALKEMGITGESEISDVLYYLHVCIVESHKTFYVTMDDKVYQMDIPQLSAGYGWDAALDIEHQCVMVRSYSIIPDQFLVPVCELMKRFYDLEYSELSFSMQNVVFPDWGRGEMVTSWNDTLGNDWMSEYSTSISISEQVYDELSFKMKLSYQGTVIDIVEIVPDVNNWIWSDRSIYYSAETDDPYSFELRTAKDGVVSTVNSYVQCYAASENGVFYVMERGKKACGQLIFHHDDGTDVVLDSNVELLWSDRRILEREYDYSAYNSDLQMVNSVQLIIEEYGGFCPQITAILNGNKRSNV